MNVVAEHTWKRPKIHPTKLEGSKILTSRPPSSRKRANFDSPSRFDPSLHWPSLEKIMIDSETSSLSWFSSTPFIIVFVFWHIGRTTMRRIYMGSALVPCDFSPFAVQLPNHKRFLSTAKNSNRKSPTKFVKVVKCMSSKSNFANVILLQKFKTFFWKIHMYVCK